MRSTKIRLLMLPLAAAAVLTVGGCSSDDAADTAYLSALKAGGVNTDNREALIAKGKQICEDLKGGTPAMDLVESNGGGAQGAATVGAAIGAYCKDQQGKLTAG